MKQPYAIVVCLLLLLVSVYQICAVEPEEFPIYRLQSQSSSTVGLRDSIILSAQARDDVALDWAWLETDTGGPLHDLKAWWDADWVYCKLIIINHEMVEEDFTNFTVLVSCIVPEFSSYAQVDGDDFLFIDKTNSTQLSHEIEYYNSEIGQLIAWVKIPHLSSTEDTVLYLYYGNPGCGSQQDIQGAWNEGYCMVHHMQGSSWEHLDDSTSNHWDVTSAGGNPTYNQQGKIGGCVGFDGDSDYLKTSGFRLISDSSYTASVWVRVVRQSSDRMFFEGDSDNALSLGLLSSNEFKAICDTEPGIGICYSTTEVTSTHNPSWFYICSRVDAGHDLLDLFVNGSSECTDVLEGIINLENQGLNIGIGSGDGRYMDGRIDELRISIRPLSDAWIATEYAMMTNPSSFISIGNGSPMKMQENDEWQWSNFTWVNPSLSDGTEVNWRIYYEDTLGNISWTEWMSFTVVDTNSPPNTPGRLIGPTSGYVDISYTFSTPGISDIDNDDIAFMVDWDDGTPLEWSDFAPSGLGGEWQHAWSSAGSYSMRVKAKDRYEAESDWSERSTIDISEIPVHSLAILAPAKIIEGTSFHVTVTAESVPLEDVQVSFASQTMNTDENGLVTFISPFVDQHTDYDITAEKNDYASAVETITVLNRQESAQDSGFIYGTVYDEWGNPVENARVCILLSEETSEYTCDYTNDLGEYLLIAPAGSYLLEVNVQGYELFQISDVEVGSDEAVQKTIILQGYSSESESAPDDIVDYALQYGITEGLIGGEVIISSQGEEQTIVYDESLSLEISDVADGQLQVTVSSTNDSFGTIIALRIDPVSLFDQNITSLDGITVTYDGQVLALANNSGDIFQPLQDSEQALWAGLVTKKLYVLIAIPHFSEHEITLSMVYDTVEELGGIMVVLSYIVLAGLLSILFVSPKLFNILRRRRYLK